MSITLFIPQVAESNPLPSPHNTASTICVTYMHQFYVCITVRVRFRYPCPKRNRISSQPLPTHWSVSRSYELTSSFGKGVINSNNGDILEAGNPIRAWNGGTSMFSVGDIHRTVLVFERKLKDWNWGVQHDKEKDNPSVDCLVQWKQH